MAELRRIYSHVNLRKTAGFGFVIKAAIAHHHVVNGGNKKARRKPGF
jgi:hypothetical protein